MSGKSHSQGKSGTPTSNSNARGGTPYIPKSNNSYYAPFGGWQGFMHSYGLKPWDDDDVQEGHAIVDAMKRHDRHDWEEEQAGRSSKASGK